MPSPWGLVTAGVVAEGPALAAGFRPVGLWSRLRLAFADGSAFSGAGGDAVMSGVAPCSASVPPNGPSGLAVAATERALLRRARSGDLAAFEELLAPVMRPAYQLAVRLLGDRHLAEDVAQEAFTRAYTGLRQFRGDARFGTWVMRIVHNACADALRSRARHPQVPVAFGQEPGADEPATPDPADSGPGPEDVVLERQGRTAILAAVAALPADHRAVVLLRDVQGLSYEEIATITGQNVGTVKSRLHRARAALRSALQELAPGKPGAEPFRAGDVPTAVEGPNRKEVR